MNRLWQSKRSVVGLLLLGVLGAVIFWQVWPVMTAVSVPRAFETFRESHPGLILVWINVLYVGAAVVSLLPAALVWVLNGGERRVRCAMLASAPLIGLLLGEAAYGRLAFDLDIRVALLLWDGAKIELAAIAIFVTFDVLRRLTTRWSKRGTDKVPASITHQRVAQRGR